MSEMIHNIPPIGDLDISISVHAPQGAYWINHSFVIHTFIKPNVFHRLFTRILLGWKWEPHESN